MHGCAVAFLGLWARTLRASRLLLAALLAFVCVASVARADEVLAHGAPPVFSADRGRYLVTGSVYRGTDNALLAKADPGQKIQIIGRFGLNSGPLVTPTKPSRATVVSVTGATLVPGANVYYPDGQHPEYFDVLPYTFEARGRSDALFYLEGAPLWVTVGGVDKHGKGVPVRVKFRIEEAFNDFTSGQPAFKVDDTFTVVVPVTDTPAVDVQTQIFSTHAGELRPGGAGTLQYTVRATGEPMTELTFVARLPKGTTYAGSMSPVDGVLSGDEITWTRPGPVTQFAASVGIRVKDRPGTKKTQAKSAASVRVRDFRRTARGTLTIPIPAAAAGSIVYYAPKGVNGPVAVGGEYPFACTDWDADAGEIFVTLDDQSVTSVSPAAPYGTFKVPPFRDPDLEQVLSAHQTGKPADVTVTGDPDCDVEFAVGDVRVVDAAGAFVRKLKTGYRTATGEADLDQDPGTTQFGLVQVNGPTSAVMLARYDARRLLYARGGDVQIFGEIRVARLVVQTAKTAKRLDFEVGGDFTAYDPAGHVDLTQLDGTLPGPPVIYGFARSTNFHTNGPLLIDGGLLYVEGDAEIVGDVSGQGALIVTGNLTHRGKFQMRTNNALVLGVGGTFTTLR